MARKPKSARDSDELAVSNFKALKGEAKVVDVEVQRTRLKTLITLGKERGFLTYAEINDHLPDMVDAEQIDAITTTFNEMGIQVYDEAPDAETLLLNEAAPTVADDEDAAEEAAQALSTVDSEFGRTTDPVRMYMREMGSVELLTREGEIEIAKRIEDGLKHMIHAISSCPTTIQDILNLADMVEKDELRIDEVIDGLVDPNEDEVAEAELSDDDIDEEEIEEEEDEDGSIAAANLEQLKQDSLARFNTIRKLYKKMRKALTEKGHRSRAYKDLQEEISAELMQIRFTAKQVERLCNGLRSLVDSVRQRERHIQELCVKNASMPRPHFIKSFPGNETNLKWIAE